MVNSRSKGARDDKSHSVQMHHSCYKCRTWTVICCFHVTNEHFFFVDGILVIILWLKINLLVSDWESRKTINKKTDKAGLWGSSKHQETLTPKSPRTDLVTAEVNFATEVHDVNKTPNPPGLDLWPPCGRFEQGLKLAHYITFLCSVNSQANECTNVKLQLRTAT